MKCPCDLFLTPRYFWGLLWEPLTAAVKTLQKRVSQSKCHGGRFEFLNIFFKLSTIWGNNSQIQLGITAGLWKYIVSLGALWSMGMWLKHKKWTVPHTCSLSGVILLKALSPLDQKLVAHIVPNCPGPLTTWVAFLSLLIYTKPNSGQTVLELTPWSGDELTKPQRLTFVVGYKPQE